MTNNIFDTIYDDDLSGLKEILKIEPEQSKAVRLEDGMTPLILACEYERVEAVRVLLTYGANVNRCLSDGESPLHIAAFECLEECVKLLLNAKANPNVQTIEGKTPLMNAAQCGSISIISKLLSSKANIHTADNLGRSALHWASVGQHDNGDVIRILIGNGANQNQQNRNGDTPKAYAIIMNKLNIAKAFA